MKKLLPSLALIFALTSLSRADTVVVFNEVMYHPATNEPLHEWIELRNLHAVDVDISDWSLTGMIDFTFPSNSIIRGGAHLIVARSPATMMGVLGSTNVYGPFTNRLENDGGLLRLRNNSGRVMDELNYGTDDDWPVAPDGSGVSLAKRDPETASGTAANWTGSEQMGGTPGAINFPALGASPPETRLVAIDAGWKYEASGTDLGTGWSAPGYGDGGWASRHGLTNRVVPGLFNTGLAADGNVAADGAADAHYILSYTAQGTPGMSAIVTLNHSAWAANDSVSKWISVVNPGTTSINGGGYGYQTTFSLAGFILSTVRVTFNVAIDNAMTNVFLNGTAANLAFTGFAGFSGPFTLSSGFVSGVNTLEFGTENQGAGPGAFRATVGGAGLGANTNSPLPLGPTTYYFRKSFSFSGDPAYTTLKINPILADGAVFYLNGVEVYRQNMPGGPVSFSTPALSNVAAPGYSGPITIAASNLVFGGNVLAVEVHQAAGSPDGPLFGTELSSTPLPAPPVTLAFNEFSASTNAEFWLELVNYGATALSLNGFVIVRDGPDAADNEFIFPAGPPLNAGAYRAVTNTTLGFHPQAGDRLYLLPPARNKVIDSVVVKSGSRARSTAGTGPFLRPNVGTPGGANSFALHTEIVINEIMYNHALLPALATNLPPRESPEAWIELLNVSSNAVDLGGWELDGGVRFNFTPGTMIPGGGYLVVADDAPYLRALYPAITIVGNLVGRLSGNSDRILLKDPAGNPADEVKYFDRAPWPEYADGGGSSIELCDARLDNSKPEAWADSSEGGKTGWFTNSYRMTAGVPAGSGQPTVWADFIFGLLGAGECLIDDLSVIQNPATSPVQLISNGDFSSGLATWRVLGTHGRSFLDTDPLNPGNNVLHVVATGPQEHMHNHVERTLNNQTLPANGTEYQISYRVKWLAGNNLLNTRLYFNRCARTVALPMPALNGTPGAANNSHGRTGIPTFSGFGHQPVIPQPGAPVTVTATAQAPGGVNGVQLFRSVNGGAAVSVAMTLLGGGRYSGVIPGQSSGAIVQFWVLADGAEADATYPAAGANSGALYQVADGQANLTLTHNIRVVLTPANRDLMYASTNLMSNDRLPGTVIVDEARAYYNCGIRLKGSERGRPNNARVSFHLEFPPDDPFRGVHPFMLVDRSGAGDSTGNKQQEMLIKHILLRAGGIPNAQPDICRVIAPNPAHTDSALLMPRAEDEFLDTHFANGGDGGMWELELIYYPNAGQTNGAGYKFVQSSPNNDSVTGTDISNVGNDKETYRYNFIIKNHRGEDDYAPFMRFAQSWSLSGATLDAQTRQVMDVDEWMRVWAVVNLCGVGDTYSFGNSHNLFMYQRPSDGKFVPIPTDMDFSFNRPAGAAITNNVPDNVNLWRILTLPSNLRCFYAHVLDLIATSYNTSYMAYWVPHYATFAPGQSYASVLSTYMPTRITTALNEINNAGGNAAFAITSSTNITTGTNLVTISGTAPVQVKTICVNGVEYTVTWTSLSAWTLRVPVATNGVNTLTVAGYDVHGRVLTNFTRMVTVTYTGPAPVPQGAVVINEIHYNPLVPDTGFVELFNTSSNLSFDLSGWRLNGADYTFPSGSVLTNRGFLVLANDSQAYLNTYSNAPPAFDRFSGNLDDNGETLTLFQPGSLPAGEIVVDRVRYEALPPWAANANGLGSSLQLIDARQDNSRVGNWTVQDGEWVSVTYTGTIQSNGTTLLLFLVFPGDVYIDDLILVAGAVPGAGPNLLQNGGFEAPLSGTWTNLGGHSNSVASADFARSGAFSLHVVTTSGGGAGSAVRQIFAPFLTNTQCTLSFWYRPTINGSTFTFRTTPGSGFNGSQNVQNRPLLVTPGANNSVASSLSAFPPVWLNEVQPENLAGLMDAQGEREPWVEIHNAGTTNVSLDGWYLANNYAGLDQWAFPSNTMLMPGEFKVVICDGETNETTAGEWHTNFRLNPTNGSVALSWSPNGIQILDYLNYAGIRAGRSYGDFPDAQPFFREEFYRPTPGGTNDNLAAPLTVFINEWMAQNNSGLFNTNNNNKHDDWFEIYNPGAAPADLGGYYLTDDLSNPFQFQIPSGTVIPPQSFLHIWADGQAGLNTNTDPALHVSFKLEETGEAIALFGGNGTLIDAIAFGSQYGDISEGRYPDGPAAQWIAPFTIPTPAAPNAIYANRYPGLAAIPNATAYVNLPFQFTAVVNDPDVPPQMLAFSLDPGAPTNATVHAGTGAFAWTPTAAQADTTNVITLRVTDNGSPVLQTERTFTVIVRAAVLLGGITAGPGGAISFNVLTTPGKTYRVEYKNDLNDAMWTHLPPDHPAAGTSLTINDTIGAQPQRFYRVVQLD